ncbi:MAG: carbon-nitrogen hydrolase family protein [Pseudomonadota bacterium]
MKVGLIQCTSSDDPAENLTRVQRLIRDAADQGATFVLTPEVTNCLSTSRAHQKAVLTTQDNDVVLSGLRQEAKTLGLWILAGSLALKLEGDDKFANRSILIDPSGVIRASYDKINMFDVDVSATETYRESDGYKAGASAVLADGPDAKLGLTICYDLRFPGLYRDLAQAGADILTVPAAFSHETGPVHWEPLLRARAIETGCYVLAPAQTGRHTAARGRERQTHGHSLVVDPWGRILADGGTDEGVVMAELDLSQVRDARRRIPSLSKENHYILPA